MVMSSQFFIEPINRNVKLWRYMNFAKYLSMLINKGLWFTRLPTLEDEFECSSPKSHLDILKNNLKGKIGEKQIQEILEGNIEVARIYREWIFINCWHMNPEESYDMWKIYSNNNESISIQTTYRQLSDLLPKDISLSMVRYIDYEEAILPFGYPVQFAIYKREAYKYENEIRAIKTGEFPIEDRKDHKAIFSEEKLIPGEIVPIDLNKLIHKVIISPLSENWFYEIVKNVSKKFLLNAPIEKSSLNNAPIYLGF